MYWGLEWWAWTGMGAAFLIVTLALARVLLRAFVRVHELNDALGKARSELDAALGVVRDSAEEARGRLEALRERSPEGPEPPAANLSGR